MKSLIATKFRVVTLMALAIVVAGCSVEDQDMPTGFIGPSGMALTVSMSASPDQLPRDGSSQSVITFTVRNDSGRPVAGQRLAIGTSAGFLSATEVVTGSDGRATVTLTAPPPGSVGNIIQVTATPVGDNALNAVTRSLVIAVSGISNSTAPAPQFTVTPEAPGAGETATFDASGTTDEGAPCVSACTYTWNFGDGTGASGRIVNHIFRSAGSFTVRLTVTDAAGTSTTIQRVISVNVVAAPIVSLTASPAAPEPGRQTTFTASAEAATGHSIVEYRWDFGDGTSRTTTSPSTSKSYSSPGVYVVTVTVRDDLGATASASLQVNVPVVAAPTVQMTVAPAQPRSGQLATFSAAAVPAPGHSIVSYRWNFGDGRVITTTSSTATHTYAVQGIYVATVTVTDDLGQTGDVSREINVQESAVNVRITFSPTDPAIGQRIHFTALVPVAPDGATIQSFEWNFGDPTVSGGGTRSGQSVEYTYTTGNTFVVTLRTVDSNGVVGVATTTVTVG